MKKISLLLAMALAAITLSACSASPKSNPPTVSNPAPAVAAKTDPTQPTATEPSADPVAKTISDPVKVPVKPRVAPTPAPILVTIQNFAFKPASLTVKKGQTIKWINKDSTLHTVSSDTFKSNVLQQNNFFTNTFDTAGNFSYHCTFHPSMTGSVIVKP